MSDTGQQTAGAGVNLAGIGSVAWSGASNVTADDGANATASTLPNTPDGSNYLKATTFGFSIPTGATIDGIEAHAQLDADRANRNYDLSVKLVIGGSVTGDEKARGTGATEDWENFTEVTWGGSSDLWGTTPTAAQVNASDFGFAIASYSTDGERSIVDVMLMTIYFTSASLPTSDGGGEQTAVVIAGDEPMKMTVDAAVVVPVNVTALLDDTDFKTRETAIAYNAAGMDLVWNFVTPAGVVTQTAVTPTTAGVHDWTHSGDGMYTLEIPASGGTINNDTEGFGYFSGIITGVLPFRGPTIQFSPANIVDSLVSGSDLLDVNLSQISEDSTAADNLELQYDGTGLTGDTYPAYQSQFASQVAALQTAGTVSDASATTTSFNTTLTEPDNHWNDAILTFTSGTLSGQSKTIQSFANTNGVITLDGALTSAPADTVSFVVQHTHVHPVSQISDYIDNNSQIASDVSSVLIDTDDLVTDDVPGLLAALNDISIADILTTQMTESYAANGVAPTVAQALFAIHQRLMDFVISGLNLTVRRLDNSTTAFIVTHDDAADPTEAGRS